jgi:FkbM family methyltransferase
MKKMLFISPHLSTGGAPQFTLSKIEILKDSYDILCVEKDFIAPEYVVQRNKISEILGDKFISLGEDKMELIRIIEEFNPDIISMEEIPEFFLDDYLTEKIYNTNRNYLIFETTHDSSFPTNEKRWFPDKFIFVSAFNAFRYSDFDIPYEVIEYPVNFKSKNVYAKDKLGFDKSWKHIVNVGLFTPRKNQKYVFELAKKLEKHKIKFHLIGNQADNFAYYWKPLMADKPENCIVWGERSDVLDFLEASDLFLFTSKGDKNNKELNPIAIKEALEYEMPMMMFNLDVYCGKYDDYENIAFLSGDLERDANEILKLFEMENMDGMFDIHYERDENKITINYNGENSVNLNVSVKCMTSGAPMYWFNYQVSQWGGWFIIPIPAHIFKFYQNSNFRGFLLEFYDSEDKLKHSETIIVNDILPVLKPINFMPFDCSYRNYIEFFADDIYGCFNLNDLDLVLDIGANIGLFAKYMYNKNAKKVILVEANPLIKKSIETVMGEDMEKSSLYLAPLFEEKRVVDFKYSTTNSTIGSVVMDSSVSGYEELDASMDLETITMEEVISENNIERISLFKCDIEGGEYDLIESLSAEHMKMVDRFLIEFHQNKGQLQGMVDKLESYGFECEFYKLDMANKIKVDINCEHGVLVTKQKK